MEIKLIITDVTRMKKPRVCIGAISEDYDSIRPVLPYPYIQENFLYIDNKEVIRPFSRITLDLIKPIADPPHTEDWLFTKEVVDYRGLLNQRQQIKLLERILDPSVDSIFGTQVNHLNTSCFVAYGTGRRSLGTVKVKSIVNVHLTNNNGKISYRISFVDQLSNSYYLSVTDLSFRYYVKYLINQGQNDLRALSENIKEKLQKAETFLRIGLGRAWSPPDSNLQPQCYMFITGIYTFPDYLGGRCYADFGNHLDTTLPDHDEIPF